MVRSHFSNPLPGVPDVESPFFERIFASKTVSAEGLALARQLRENGYAVIDFPDSDFDARAARIKADLAPHFDFDDWKTRGWSANEGLRIQDAWRSNDDVKAIAANPGILNLLSEIYGRAAFPFQTLNFPVGTQQETHNDSVHFSSIPERFMCGVWVALEDTDDCNGSLEYYPGSHSLPQYINEHIGVCAAQQFDGQSPYGSFLNLWKELIDTLGIERESFHAKKGQALIWASNLLHGGSRHMDPKRTRWSQVTHYYFRGCTYYTPLYSDPVYGSILYRRLIDISSEEEIDNEYSGFKIPEEVIKNRLPGAREHQTLVNIPEDFDAEIYLDLNPDVKESGADATEHYTLYGYKEGRKWRL